MHKILKSGSEGNAVVYHGSIVVDCGIPYSLIEPVIDDIQIVLATHKHLDHFNLSTLRRIQFERPTVRFACGPWMAELFQGFKNVDILDFGKWYDYGPFKVALIKLYHDVPNCGYRIEKDGHKTIHATDTCHLEGVSAKDYDLFCIESNYDENVINQVIAEKKAKGEFTHLEGSINSHLSDQQCNDFFYENRKEDSVLVRLHQSKHV